MSSVTNVILAFSVMEEENFDSDEPPPVMRQVNAWLTEQGHWPFGSDANAHAGGEKYLETYVYIAAFNYLVLEEFLAMLRTLDWKEPQYVQVLVQGDDEHKFHLVEPCA